jgi:hypothetical protein
MQLDSTCNTIRQWERIAKELYANDLADIVHHESVPKSNGEKEEVIVYQIFIRDVLEPVKVRFWYNTEFDKACFKISQQGMDLLLQSTTVMSLMFKLGQTVNKNGHGINMDDLEALMKKATVKLTGKEEKFEITG